MSDMSASVVETADGFVVSGYEKLNYDFKILDGVFDVNHSELANCYTKWGRVLTVMDKNMSSLYGDEIKKYFDHYSLPITIHAMPVGEKAKTFESLLGICDAMTAFGIIRKEPVLVVGGGLVTDVAGFACACYRRNTNFIRVPTTLIGLIDASVSIKVAVNYGQYKNRLGAYHAPIRTFLDFTFLRTLPLAQVRNGFAEIIKISSCAHLSTFELLNTHCEDLISTRFGRSKGSDPALKSIADKICYEAISVMLKLETPNLHEIMLDRIIAYGHTWSPFHELQPSPPLRHGHAISIDMAFSATLALETGLLGKEEHTKLIKLFSRAGLAIDHHLFDDVTIEKGTAAILKTRDGQLRLAVPNPLGNCTFINDYTLDGLKQVLVKHKEIATQHPRKGAGIEAYVDNSDTGEVDGVQPTINGEKPTPNGIDCSLPINTKSNDITEKIDAKAQNGMLPNGNSKVLNRLQHGNGHMEEQKTVKVPA